MWTRMNELERMLNSMDLFRSRLGNAFFEFDQVNHPRSSWLTTEGFPRTNLHDKGDDLELKVEVPGITKDDLNVKIQGNYLEISGKKSSSAPEGYKAHRVEKDSSSFSRSFTLPYEVDAENAKASLTEGILTMNLPKAEAAKPKKVAIN